MRANYEGIYFQTTNTLKKIIMDEILFEFSTQRINIFRTETFEKS